MSPFLVTCCFAGFIVLGATQSLYGPAIPAFLRSFQIGTGAASLALAAQSVGAAVGVLLYARLRRTAPARVLVATAYATMAAGSLAFAASPNWPVAVAAALLLGLGAGAIDYGLNGLAAADDTPRGTARLNILHACFGVGAIAGPWLLGTFGDARYTAAFAACAAAATLLALATLVRFPAADPDARSPASPEHRPLARTRTVVAGFIAFYVILVGIETGVGGWEPTHLIGLGYTPGAADRSTAGFWFAMTAGRLLVVPLVKHVSPRWLVTACFAGLAAALLTATTAPIAPASYILAGLFIAPIFPTGLPWLLQVAPDISGAMAWVFAASMLGGVIVPPALGLAIATVGASWLPVCLAALSVIGCLICLALLRARTPRDIARLAVTPALSRPPS